MPDVDRWPRLLPLLASAVVGFAGAAGVIVGVVPVGLAAIGGGLTFVALLPVRPQLVLTCVAAVAAATALWSVAWTVSWSLL